MKVGKKNESGKKKENVENVLVQASNLTRLENVVKWEKFTRIHFPLH